MSEFIETKPKLHTIGTNLMNYKLKKSRPAVNVKPHLASQEEHDGRKTLSQLFSYINGKKKSIKCV